MSKISQAFEWSEGWEASMKPIEKSQETGSETSTDDFIREWPHGIDFQHILTPEQENLNCSQWVKKKSSELIKKPICDCPPGQMRNIKGNCISMYFLFFI